MRSWPCSTSTKRVSIANHTCSSGGIADHVANYKSEQLRREVNALIKEIGQIKRNKGNADDLLAQKAEKDKEVAKLTAEVNELAKKRDGKAFLLGNIVDKNSAVSTTEVCSLT
jgi:seryl-tRNA synthetase